MSSALLLSVHISINRFFGVDVVSLRIAVRLPDGETRRATMDSCFSTGAEMEFDGRWTDRIMDRFTLLT